MHHHILKRLLPLIFSTTFIFVVVGGALVYESMQITALTNRVDILTDQVASTTRALAQNVTDLHNQTTGLSNTIQTTQKNIDEVQNKVGGVAQTVGSISGTVDNLKKLAAVDPALLKKYSKIFFMNENYVPAHLTIIPTDYLYTSTRQEQFLTESWPYLRNLLNAAKGDGVTLYVKSGYRSFAEQKSLKSSYSVTYGAGTANAFSADQGYSEHQLGTTIDFISTGTGGSLTGFDKTTSYTWLLANAHRFGFTLSYPQNNKYYLYEPWHWRFVGIKLATYLRDNNLHFYDMDQRDIDTYLINTFDWVP